MLKTISHSIDMFLRLDKNHNGSISPQELSAYGTGGLTREFIHSLFQQLPLVNKEMVCFLIKNYYNDTWQPYHCFVDFVIAMENKKHPKALAYFFNALDVKKVGYLTTYNINVFYKAVYNIKEVRRMRAGATSDATPLIIDVRDELFDMAKPKNPLQVTLEDLVACGLGDMFINVLTDADLFTIYDNRFNVPLAPPPPPSGPL